VSIAHLGPLQRVVPCCQGTMIDARQMRTYGSGHFDRVRQRGHMAGSLDEPEGAIANEASNDLGQLAFGRARAVTAEHERPHAQTSAIVRAGRVRQQRLTALDDDGRPRQQRCTRGFRQTCPRAGAMVAVRPVPPRGLGGGGRRQDEERLNHPYCFSKQRLFARPSEQGVDHRLD
jgi:hypothetical protein